LSIPGSESRDPRASAAAAPTLRLFGDLGSWTLGQPLVTGSGDVVVQLDLAALDDLLVTLGADGLRSLIVVLRHATPVVGEDGFHLELPGFSAGWLRSKLPLSHKASFTASRVLQDSGLLMTASLPGARGAAGGQRAVLTGLVAAGGTTADITPIRRGRRALAGSAKASTGTSVQPTSVLQDLENREREGGVRTSAESANMPNPPGNPQVSAVLPEPRNRSSTARSSRSQVDRRSSTSAEEVPPAAAPPAETRADPSGTGGVPASASGPAEASMLSAAPSLWALQDRLAGLREQQPRALVDAVRAVFATRPLEARRLAAALNLPGDDTPAGRVTAWFIDVLTANPIELRELPGSAGSVFARLRDAGVVVPTKVAPVDVLVRVAVSACAGLDGDVADWRRWLASAMKRPATNWGVTDTPKAIRIVLDLAWRAELAAPRQIEDFTRGADHRSAEAPVAALARSAGTGGPAGLGTILSEATPPAPVRPPGPPYRPASGAAPPAATRPLLPRPEAILPFTDEPPDELLAAAVAAVPFFTRMGLAKVASRPHLRAACLEQYHVGQYPDPGESSRTAAPQPGHAETG
jgi:hypothetical protein